MARRGTVLVRRALSGTFLVSTPTITERRAAA